MTSVQGRRPGAAWTRVGYGLYLNGPDQTLRAQLNAYADLLPASAVFTHLTAAEVRGWWLPKPRPHSIQVAVAATDRHPQRRGLAITRLSAAPEIEIVQGLHLATAAETLLAVACDVGVLDLVTMADSALRAGDCTLDQLSVVAAQRRRGAPRLREVVPLLDARSESAWESILRTLHGAAGIAVEPQYEIFDANRRFVARADLWLVGTRRIHEYDGEVHRDLSTHRKDLSRDRRLIETGWQRHGYTATEVLRQGGPIIASVDALFGRRWDPERLAGWRALVRSSSYGQ